MMGKFTKHAHRRIQLEEHNAHIPKRIPVGREMKTRIDRVLGKRR